MKTARIIYGATMPDSPHYNADLRWRIRMRLHDPHFFVEFPGRPARAALIASALEINRARNEAHDVKIESAEGLRKGIKAGETLGALRALLRQRKISEVILHPDTSVEIAELLRAEFRILVGGRPWYPERMKKTSAEIESIKESIRAAEEALYAVRERLSKASVRRGILHEGGNPLTSEMLRDSVEERFFKNGFFASGTITSSGAHAADPHAIGKGAISVGSPIVCDFFPYSRRTGFFADITRTFFKGKPSAARAKTYKAVLAAEERGIALLTAGIDGSDIHKAVSRVLGECGFKTDSVRGRGFIHSTGHGVGLECHEMPHIGGTPCVIPAGSVVTVEPGLYYPDDSYGIRIEDMVLVQKNGSAILTSFPKDFASAVID